MAASVEDRDDTATFRCAKCGHCKTFGEHEYKRLHWLSSKFGFVNHTSALNRLIDCCDRPYYYCDIPEGGAD